MSSLERIPILGVGIDILTSEEVLHRIEGWILSGKPHTLSFANPEIVMFARRRRDYREFINSADIVAPDGIGLIWASRIFGKPLKERVTGTDMMYYIAEASALKGFRLYFVGGRPGIAEEATEKLRALYPEVNVVGTWHGFFSEEEEQELIDDVISKKPDILVVCLGMYRQEMWIKRNKHRLNVPVCFGNGGALDFVSGRARRAPKWMLSCGLEWLFRLMREPLRAKRQFILLPFVLLILSRRLSRLFKQENNPFLR